MCYNRTKVEKTMGTGFLVDKKGKYPIQRERRRRFDYEKACGKGYWQVSDIDMKLLLKDMREGGILGNVGPSRIATYGKSVRMG